MYLIRVNILKKEQLSHKNNNNKKPQFKKGQRTVQTFLQRKFITANKHRCLTSLIIGERQKPPDNTSYPLGWLLKNKETISTPHETQQKISTGKNVEKLEPW